MKVYLFNPQDGLYAGESFEGAETLEYVEGVTPISPPPYRAGEVPVFDSVRMNWTIVPVSLVRERLADGHSEKVEKSP